MRRLLGGLIVVLTMGCSKSDSATGPTAPTTGVVVFKLDANTCTASIGSTPISVIFYIDGSTVGTATVSVTQSSPPYTVSAGSHVLSARLANTGYQWANITATVPARTTYAAVLLCT